MPKKGVVPPQFLKGKKEKATEGKGKKLPPGMKGKKGY